MQLVLAIIWKIAQLALYNNLTHSLFIVKQNRQYVVLLSISLVLPLYGFAMKIYMYTIRLYTMPVWENIFLKLLANLASNYWNLLAKIKFINQLWSEIPHLNSQYFSMKICEFYNVYWLLKNKHDMWSFISSSNSVNQTHDSLVDCYKFYLSNFIVLTNFS